jgi:hypothetical protein
MNNLIKLLAMSLLVIVACVAFQASSASSLSLSQIQTGKFKGTVMDMNGRSIGGAIVTVKNSNGIIRQLKSDSAGEFSIQLPVGIYEIVVEHSGFMGFILVDVGIKAGVSLSHTFRLEPSHSLQTSSQSTHLNGRAEGIIVNLVCEPMPNTRITMKNKRWEQIITPDQSGRFIVDAPTDDYLITVSSAKPQAFVIRRGRNGEIYLIVDTGETCDHCRCPGDYEDMLIPNELVIPNTSIEERRIPSRP